MMWEDNGLQVARITAGQMMEVEALLGRSQGFLYWRLRPYPERVATREDLEKAISYPPHLEEALIWLENPEIADLNNVLQVRRRIMKSVGL
jgi:hypothetical protein